MLSNKFKAISLIAVNSATLLVLFQNCSTLSSKNKSFADSTVHGTVCAANPDSTVAEYSLAEFKIASLPENATIESITNNLAEFSQKGNPVPFQQTESNPDCYEQKSYSFGYNDLIPKGKESPSNQKFFLYYISEPDQDSAGSTRVYGKLFSKSDIESTKWNLNPSDFSYVGEF